MNLLGRDTELAQLRTYVQQRQHTLIVGAIGVGKSALLRAALADQPVVLVIEQLVPFKASLLTIAQQLHQRNRLQLPMTEAHYLTWEEVQPHLTRLSVVELAHLLTPLLTDAVLVLDDCDAITPITAHLLESFFAQTLIIGAMTELPLRHALQRFVWHFRVIALTPLTQPASHELLWQRVDATTIPAPYTFEQHVLQMANGNPLAITELAQQAQRVPIATPEQMRHLHHDAGIHYIDLTLGLLVLGAVAVICRFLALGLNDIDAYILAGSMGACFLVVRFFIYRSLRRSR